MMPLTALATEFLKLHRARVPWFTLAALMMGPLGLSLFMWIVMEPDRAAQLGLLGAKADFSGLEANWPSYAMFIVQIVGTGGMLLLAFIVAYVFGREYDDNTAKNMLALPVARHWFAVAKLAVSAAWWFAIVAVMIAEAIAIGLALGLPGFSAGLVAEMAANTMLAAGISYLLVPVVAWVTVWGRGNMAPIGFAIGMLLLGNLIGSTGWAVWFPWSIVPLLVGSVGQPVDVIPAGSYVVVGLTFVAGVVATILHLRWADVTQ
jgi:ABC-2 type transport system permease protein